MILDKEAYLGESTGICNHSHRVHESVSQHNTCLREVSTSGSLYFPNRLHHELDTIYDKAAYLREGMGSCNRSHRVHESVRKHNTCLREVSTSGSLYFPNRLHHELDTIYDKEAYL